MPVPNVMPISGTNAIKAARLCNMPTGIAALLIDHQNWLDNEVQPVIRRMQGPWVDLKAYASHRGDARGYNNKALSEHRCVVVKNRISEYANSVNFQMATSVGSSESTGGIENDEGYWRAVEVYVYATRPPAPKPEAPQVDGSTEFQIRLVKGGSFGLFAEADAADFEIVDPKSRQSAIFHYGGVGGAVPTPGGAEITISRSGPFFPFKTTRPVKLRDFEGDASLDGDPGASLGSHSVLGTSRLTIESSSFFEKGATTIPSILPCTSSWSVGGSAGTKSKGFLKLTKIVATP